MPTIEKHTRSNPQPLVLHDGQRSVVVKRHATGHVVIKSSDDVARLRHELGILRLLHGVRGVVGVLDLLETREPPGLVLEYVGSSTLRASFGRPWQLGPFLESALQLAEILERVHARGVIHGNLDPTNIVVGRDGTLTLIDFALSLTGPERASLSEREGMLTYVSPEQTGRTERLVDERSDLYALGVLFYEMLTGAPPFRSRDPLEVIHAHLARAPVSPSVVVPRVPTIVSEIVLKLLEKMPEARYQTAAALAADLRETARRHRTRPTIEPFDLGSVDLARELPLPERLYGRERELELLRAAVDRVAGGACELVLVAGDPGIGKSALGPAVRELIAGRRGRFISGKLDLRAANVPFAALVEALRALLRSIAAESSARRAALRTDLLIALGDRGGALVEVLPELTELIGKQPKLAPLAPYDAQTRFYLTLLSFLQVFATEESPLAIFLDDLQWGDPTTIDALRWFASNPDCKHLLVVGAFRPREMRQDLRTAIAPALILELAPIATGAVEELIADALRASREEVRPLAELVTRKTAGNPFFVRQVLRSLQKTGLLVYNVRARAWRWDLARIQRVAITENVVDLLVRAIRELPPEARQLLPVAACLGKTVEPAILADVLERPLEPVREAMRSAAREGLVIADEADAAGHVTYRFAHDRVQQAAYSLLTEDERTELHHRIGLRIARAGDVFAIVDQLNLGAGALKTVDERRDLARWNLRAGLRSKAASAHSSALHYFRAGLVQLDVATWSDEHDLMLALHREASESAYLSGDHALSEHLVETALRRTRDPLERAELHNLSVISATSRGAWADALRVGRVALHELGHEIPGTEFSREEELLQALLSQRPLPSVLDAPRLIDALDQAVFRLLVNLQPPAWFHDRAMFDFLTVRGVRFMFERGLGLESVSALCNWTIHLSAIGEFVTADEAGKLARELGERFRDPGQLAHAIYVRGAFVREWLDPLLTALPEIQRGFELAMQASEMRTAAYALSSALIFTFSAGRPLNEVLEQIERGLAVLKKIRNETLIAGHVAYRQAIRCLTGETRTRGRFDDDGFDEAVFLASVGVTPAPAFIYRTERIRASFLFRNLADAYEHIQKAESLYPFLEGHVPSVDYTFYGALTLAALCDGAPDAQRQDWLARVGRAWQRLARWAASSQANFRHMQLLVEAEIARVEGRHLEASDLYERSTEAAAVLGRAHHEATAAELAGRHAHARGRDQVARMYLRRASDAYARWGATEKVRALSEEFPVLERESKGAFAASEADLELMTLFKAAESITTEVVLPRLLEKLIFVCAEAAGAERVAVVLEEAGRPFVRAYGGLGQAVLLKHRALSESKMVAPEIVEQARVTRLPFVIDDTRSDPRVTSTTAKSVLALPVQRQGTLVAVLYFENDLMTHAFTSARLRTLELLSAQIAVSLSNSLLFEERARAEETVRFLSESTAVLAASLDFAATLGKLATLVVPFLADWCVIDVVLEDRSIARVASHHVDPEKAALLAELTQRYPAGWDSPGTASQVIRKGEPLLVPDLHHSLGDYTIDGEHARQVRRLGAESGMVVPLVARGRVFGAMMLVSGNPEHRYGPADVSLAQEVARRAAIAIDNAFLYRTEQESVRLRDEFLQVAAHELRTPLHSLRLGVDALLKGTITPLPENALRVSRLAQQQVVRLTRVVDELVMMSRIEAGSTILRRESLDLAAIVHETVAAFRDDLARAKCTIEVNAERAVVGEWDRVAMSLMSTQLLSNAIKFGAGKPIDVTVRANEGNAEFVVRDRGMGIAAESLPRVFDRFMRGVSAREYGGLGLGLYMVRSLVEAHGGAVHVESTEGEGTTFVVTLPMKERS